MTKIFINYRRDDSGGWIDRIDSKLVAEFGRTRVFLDTASLHPGATFPDVIRETIANCQVMLVVIGALWASVRTDRGDLLRLETDSDWVRQEIALAFQLGLQVIPVLVGGARMPPDHVLPEPIKALARRNCAEISPRHFETDLNQLVSSIRRLPEQSAPTPPVSVLEEDHARLDVAGNFSAADPPSSHCDAPRDSGGLAPAESSSDSALTRAVKERLSHLEAEQGGGRSPLIVEIRSVARGTWDFRYGESSALNGEQRLEGPVRQQVGPSLLSELLRRLGFPFFNSDLAELVHQAFLPRAVRDALHNAQALLLVLDSEADTIPWEFAKDRRHILPLGLHLPVMRVGAVDQCYRESSAAVSNPVLTILGSTQPPFVPLSGARAEIARIAATLQARGIQVEALDGPDLISAASLLCLSSWRAVHLTGHGVGNWTPNAPSDSAELQLPLTGLALDAGMILSKDEILSADVPPALVTVGAQELGSWALELLARGCHGVCLPRMETSDQYAAEFFVSLYAALVEGHTLPRAAWKARLLTALACESSATYTALGMLSYGASRLTLYP